MIKKIFIPFIVSIFAFALISCKKTETTTTTTTIQSETWVKLTVHTSNDVVRPNYTVLMFETTAHQTPPTNTSPPVPKNPLPTIVRTAVSNSQGIAHFDLNDLVTSSTPKTYYFIAVQQDGSSYIWELPYMQVEANLKRGTMFMSSIFVR